MLTTDRQVPGPTLPGPGRWSRLAVPLVPAVAAFAICYIGIGGASFWIDEAATISVAQRSPAQMIRFFHDMDAVHALYYFIMHPVIRLFGIGEVAMRLPTVLATAGTAAGVAILGRRYATPRAGLLAGLLYAGSVTVSQYAQEARSYAMVAGVAVLTTYLFARAIEERTWRWWAGYGAAVVLLGLAHIYAVLLVAAHAVTLWWMGRETEARPPWMPWLAASGAACLLLAPFALYASGQQAQVDWIVPQDSGRLFALIDFLAGNDRLVLPMAALAGIGAAAGGLAVRTPEIRFLAAPWAVLPGLILLGVSLVKPVMEPRYVVFCLPAVALLAGAGLDWLGHRMAPLVAAALVPIVLISVPAQAKIREHDAKLDDLRAAAAVLRQNARPGDGLLYLDSTLRWDSAAYPDAYARLRDITLDRTPIQTDSLLGTDISDPAVLRARLLQGPRVWVMNRDTVDDPPETIALRRAALNTTGPYVVRGRWRYKGGQITLFVRTPEKKAAPAGKQRNAAGNGKPSPGTSPTGRPTTSPTGRPTTTPTRRPSATPTRVP